VSLTSILNATEKSLFHLEGQVFPSALSVYLDIFSSSLRKVSAKRHFEMRRTKRKVHDGKDRDFRKGTLEKRDQGPLQALFRAFSKRFFAR